MGNLIIKRVKYTGENYFFESPEFSKGLNIIVGDNGSGKSTFSYFIEFGLGGNIKYFNEGNKGEKYQLIQNDKNNYVESELLLNNTPYSFKRFLKTNDMLVRNEFGEVFKFPIHRSKDTKETFSDWILNKLDIERFEMSLGSISWQFNFNDLFRLLHYDQDTEPRKIFKSPNSENFVTDSAIIRMATFEILLGISSNQYYKALDEYKAAERIKNEKKALLDHLIQNNHDLTDIQTAEKNVSELKEQQEKLVVQRNKYLQESTVVEDKTSHLEVMQSRLVALELENSEEIIRQKNLEIEVKKIESFLKTV